MKFLEEVLSKIARRYSLKGCLNGTMKIGQHLDQKQMATLANFFGLHPLRVSSREEVHLIFKDLLENGSESQWIEKIEDAPGYPWQPQTKNNAATNREASNDILASLELAYPQLHPLFSSLQEDNSSIRNILAGNEEKSARDKCFTMAELICSLFQNHIPITVSDLGARFFQNSKALRQGELRTLLIRWLRFADLESTDIEERELLSKYHILHDRLTVNAVLYGPIIYEKNGSTFDWIYQLYQQGETATLGWQNIQDIDTVYLRGSNSCRPDLICCENEAPFSSLIQQKENSCILFTSGFPSSTVQKLYRLLAPCAANCCHWGDSDPAGLRCSNYARTASPATLPL